MLDLSIATLKGIGSNRAAAFEKLSVRTMRDLLYFMPREYQDFSVLREVSTLAHGELAAVRLTIVQEPRLVRPSRGLQLVVATAQDSSGRLQLVWYNQPYRKNQIKSGQTSVFCGKVDRTRGLKIINPAVMDESPGILPVYPLVQGLTQYQVRDAVEQALRRALDCVEESLPEYFRAQHGLCSIRQALCDVHYPKDMHSLSAARRRLSFEDMLYYLLAIALLKRERLGREGIAFDTLGVRDEFIQSLPFPPTGAQARVLKEIEEDMARERPMNRLVQGDVGSGKTILAFYALKVAAKSGYQGALMAPTEILAQQHYAHLQALFGYSVCMLRGGMKTKERELIYERIRTSDAMVVVGTHALLQSGLEFHKLGVVITDEQHRFGVRQRAQIANKGEKMPDVLIMSATPIPRTLAMILYGDLDLSVLDELPPGRRPVMTRVVPEEKRIDMYGFIKKQSMAGRQAYVVCPLVEHSDAMEVKSAQEVFEELTALLPELRIALLHGRMASAKKEAAIEAFRTGELQVLVSTTVVEVGVDVPNATVMVIENADRFGLAQLHQLRGRVGRGAEQSFCFLLGGSMGETAEKRLEIMTKTNDGFLIAQRDLELRGPGEFLGTRQHGMDELHAAQMAADMDVLFEAQSAAQTLIDEGETLGNAQIFTRAWELYRLRMREIANN